MFITPEQFLSDIAPHQETFTPAEVCQLLSNYANQTEDVIVPYLHFEEALMSTYGTYKEAAKRLGITYQGILRQRNNLDSVKVKYIRQMIKDGMDLRKFLSMEDIK